MTRKPWTMRSTFFTSLGVCLAALAGSRGVAQACGWSDGIEALITFDPAILGDSTSTGLRYDPSLLGFGGPCDNCPADEMAVDWSGFLGPSVKSADWMAVLLNSTLAELDTLILAVQGKPTSVPSAFASNSVLRAPADMKEKVLAALFFVGFARRVEPFSAAPPSLWRNDKAKSTSPRGDPQSLQNNGEKALARTKFTFLAQRYAFALLRLRFYRKDWKGVVAFFEQNESVVSAPSYNLKWRALYYLAGALRREGDRARANLLLARIHDGSPALTTVAAEDFAPMQKEDWQATLNLAASVREKTVLWRLVGLKLDGLTAMREIVALDPKSNLLALLAVREVNKAEADGQDFRALEQLTAAIALKPTTDRPWLFDLIAGHMAALRGDIKSTRPRLLRATKLMPNDGAVALQAKASLALALALSWKRPNERLDNELATALEGPENYNVLARVRQALAKACAANGAMAKASLFAANGNFEFSSSFNDRAAKLWREPKFIESVIQIFANPVTALDRFMVKSSRFERPYLDHSLAIAYLLKGDAGTAAQIFGKGALSENLGTDPFVVHIRDCHDCDHAKYRPTSKWTHLSFAQKMADLMRDAATPGPKGAAAAFAVANGYYNSTHYGNARSVSESTDTAMAEAWYKKAFEHTADREFKVKAAFMAAKCELGRLINANEDAAAQHLPVPVKWFSVVKTFADTKYYEDILEECGNYKVWSWW